MKMRIDKLLKKMEAQDIDSIFVSNLTNIYYLTGFRGSYGYFFLTRKNCYLLTDSRYVEQAKGQTEGIEIVPIGPVSLNQTLKDLACKDKARTVGFEGDHLRHNQYLDLLENAFKGLDFKNTSRLVEEIRQVKEEREIEYIRRAQRIAEKAFEETLDFVEVGRTEKEVKRFLENQMYLGGAEDLSFSTIVASGKRSAFPHATPSDKRIEKGDFLKIDFGCKYMGYCSDMTRTLFIKELSTRHEEVYNIVLEAQQEAIKSIRAGVSARKIDKISRDYIESKGYGKYFGHGLGHSLGIDIHEMPAFSPNSRDIIRENMVITVEPGIYIPDFGGVRIEDMIVVKTDGCLNLTNTSKELKII